jgi:hypothetical protein
MIYELLLENFMYPNIAAHLPRAFPRYKLSDEDYTLKLFINEAKEITILGHIDNNFLMWLSKGTLSYIKLSSTLEFLLHKRLPHVVSQYELEKADIRIKAHEILFCAKYFIKRAVTVGGSKLGQVITVGGLLRATSYLVFFQMGWLWRM